MTPEFQPSRKRGLNPVTRKRLRRFREMRRAWWSFWILLVFYGLSLVSELVAGNQPLYVRYRGRSYFPILRFYPEDAFTGSGRLTRPDYKLIARSEAFRSDAGHRMVFPPIPFGPTEAVSPESIALPDEVLIRLTREAVVGTVSVSPEGTILAVENAAVFLGMTDAQAAGRPLAEFVEVPEAIRTGLRGRFENRGMESTAAEVRFRGRVPGLVSLASYTPRRLAPAAVRLLIREPEADREATDTVRVGRDGPRLEGRHPLWGGLDAARKQELLDQARARFEGPVPEQRWPEGDRWLRASFVKESVTYPWRPCVGHPFGLDSSGRDVLVRSLYGLRTSLTFGLLLVAATMIAGIVVGALQGYYGGWVDLLGQRAIEIWESLPFLYILILMGSVFGRSFALLIICYGLFNWIGISYYMRAEFLRLRKQAFVEAAWCMGLPARKIIFRHILPNALVPVVTFFPFSLVGAVGVLAALDYLGFGLPPPTPSWGEMLSQAQEFTWAWWLSLYPSLALFIVMLLGVFIGEGVRAAFDPKRYSRLE